jgi:5-formyltetrahydrofolate cyclo-ligase
MPSSRKTAVRERLRALRRELVPGRDRARDAEELALSALEVVYAAGLGRDDWVAAYEATPIEPPTEAMVAALSARGIRVMVPVTLEDWDLDWREVGTEDTLGLEAIGRAKVVFLPAHGVDRSGTRIGQGKGCYDRVIPRTSARLVAVVHPWELLDEDLPSEPHDRSVQAVMAAEIGVVEVGGDVTSQTSSTLTPAVARSRPSPRTRQAP